MVDLMVVSLAELSVQLMVGMMVDMLVGKMVGMKAGSLADLMDLSSVVMLVDSMVV